MATPDELRDGVDALSRLARADLAVIFGQVADAVETREALRDVLPALIETYGAAAAALAADWYDNLRDEVGATGRFSAVPVELGDTGADELARWGVAPLFQSNPDVAAAKSLVEGGLQRRIANASRSTVTASSIEDPGADGWMRVGAGACAFCRMLIGRGAVYTQAGVDFSSHDHCNCQAAPKFKGAEPVNVKKYVRSTRNITDNERARVRAYLAGNSVG